MEIENMSKVQTSMIKEKFNVICEQIQLTKTDKTGVCKELTDA